jgi:hypothetical protein
VASLEDYQALSQKGQREVQTEFRDTHYNGSVGKTENVVDTFKCKYCGVGGVWNHSRRVRHFMPRNYQVGCTKSTSNLVVECLYLNPRLSANKAGCEGIHRAIEFAEICRAVDAAMLKDERVRVMKKAMTMPAWTTDDKRKLPKAVHQQKVDAADQLILKMVVSGAVPPSIVGAEQPNEDVFVRGDVDEVEAADAALQPST